MNKKGELTSTQIITIAIAIMGFIIVLTALYLIFGEGFQTDNEVCKLSVLTRATTPNIAHSYVPLKCKTVKICLTDSSSGKCNEQFPGESNVQVIRLSGTDPAKATKIEQISANAMFDCWSMMGEGKLNLFGKFLGSQGATCVICSRVAIDKSVQKSVIDLVNIDEYMEKNQIPGQSLTYLQAFTDRGVNSYASVNPDILKEKITKTEQFSPTNYDVAYVFSQITSVEYSDVFETIGLIGGTTALGTFMSPAGSFASKLLLTPTGWIIASVGAVAGGGYAFYEIYESQKAVAGYCGDFTGNSANKDVETSGCSIVQAVPYSFQDINRICGNGIQGEL